MNYKELTNERERFIARLRGRAELVKETSFKEVSTSIDRVNENLYYPLQEEEIKQFEAADGNELEEKATKANSSAALLLNVFTPIRQNGEIEIFGLGTYKEYELETKLQVLNGRGKKANLDMLLKNEESYVYIESKFTELFYYRKKNPLSISYQDKSKYPDNNIYQAIKPLWDKYHYYDANQLLKHLIGIYRDCLKNPEKYQGKKVYLLNLNWELINSIDDLKESYQLQLEALKESTDFCKQANQAIKNSFTKIGIDFRFVYIDYYELVNSLSISIIQNRKLQKYLNTRYFLNKRKRIDIEDATEYILSNIDQEISREQFLEMANKYNIISINNHLYDNKARIWLNPKSLKQINALIIISNTLNKIPRLAKKYDLDEFLIINSPKYFCKLTVICLSSTQDKIDKTIII